MSKTPAAMPQTLALYHFFSAFPEFSGHLGLEAVDTESGFAFQMHPVHTKKRGYVNGSGVISGTCSLVWYHSETGTDDRKSAVLLAARLSAYVRTSGEIAAADGTILSVRAASVPIRRRLYGDGTVWELRFSYRCRMSAV